MFKNKTRKKPSILFIGIIALLLSTDLQAQERQGGMLGLRPWFESEGMLRNGRSDNDNYNITNEDFSNGVPVGSGFGILLAAGLGYLAINKKEEKR